MGGLGVMVESQERLGGVRVGVLELLSEGCESQEMCV